MKRAVLLHGTNSHPTHNWQPWLKQQLEAAGYEVWAPVLPDNHTPNRETYDSFLRDSGWDFTDNLLVGHSSGATTVLNLLSSDWLPHIKTAVVVGTFLNERLTSKLERYPSGQFDNLFPKDGFDAETIKQKVDHLYFVHGDQDPLCSFEDAREFCEKLGGTFIAVPGGGHFSSPISELPVIIETLKNTNDL